MSPPEYNSDCCYIGELATLQSFSRRLYSASLYISAFTIQVLSHVKSEPTRSFRQTDRQRQHTETTETDLRLTLTLTLTHDATTVADYISAELAFGQLYHKDGKVL